MKNGKEDETNQFFGELNLKMRDIETRQRSLNDRMILIAENLIEFKEKYSSEKLDLKKDIESLNQSLNRIKSFLEVIKDEFPKFAKKTDIEILEKQAKMFRPLEFISNLNKKNESEIEID